MKDMPFCESNAAPSTKSVGGRKGECESLRIQLDRSGRVLLSHQLAEWLKSAIRQGEYGNGAVLPGARELAAAASVGEKTARRALAALAAEGWTTPKRHVGSVVVRRGLSTMTRYRVLFYTCELLYCYYYDQLLSTIRSSLSEDHADVSMSSVCGSRTENANAQLSESLKERWDLVIEIGAQPRSRRLIEAAGWPFLCLYDGRKRIVSKAPNCIGMVNMWTGMALPEFAKACVRCGVRFVLQVLGLPNPYDVTEMLDISGIAVETLRIANPGNPEAVALGALAAVRDWFAARAGKPHALPDVVFFTDDYAAQGGLIAMKAQGLRIPEDVRVVAHANKGHGPVWEKPLTRLMMDADRHGAMLAAGIRDYLSTGRFRDDMTLGSVWMAGETF